MLLARLGLWFVSWGPPPLAHRRVAADRTLAAAWCLGRCARCSRCRFVSLSPTHRDCSWFHACAGRLSASVAGFVTGAALQHDPSAWRDLALRRHDGLAPKRAK